MKKILLSMSMIAVVAVVAIGATGAFFSDTETSTGNTFTAGAIDLTVDSEQHYNNLVDTFAVLYGSAAHRNWDVFYSIVKNIASWPEARRKEYLEKLPKE